MTNETELYVMCWKPRSDGMATIHSQPMSLRSATLAAMEGNRRFPSQPHWVEKYNPNLAGTEDSC